MIVIEPVDKDYYQGLKMEGHADHAPRGMDVVCAGVSSALFTLYYSLCNIKGAHHIEATMEPGYAKIVINDEDLYTDAVIDGFIEVVQQIQAQYPNTIQFQGDYNHEQRL